MRKILFLLFIYTIFLYPSEKVKIRELYENGEKYRGKPVIVEGEVIGDLMGRKEERWINIKDEFEDFAIGVVISKKDVEKIENFGKYRVKGDIVRIEGIYNINCPEHQGERDIHALKVEIIKKGEKYEEKLNLKKIILCFILVGITLVLLYLSHKKDSFETEKV